jgi:integrase
MPLTLVPPKPGRTPNYHIRGTYLRVPVNRSAGTPDRRLAAKLKKRIEQEIETGIHAPSGGLTFLAATVAYMKAGGDRTFLGPIIEYDGAYAIRDKPVETIVQQDLDHIADALYPNNTPQSRNRQVYTPIIAVLHRAGVEHRFKRPKGWQGKKSKSFLEYDQAFNLLDAADAIDREFGLLCYTLLYTGRRIGDLLNPHTKLRNLNLQRGTLYLGKTKNGDPVTVPLPPIVSRNSRGCRHVRRDPAKSPCKDHYATVHPGCHSAVQAYHFLNAIPISVCFVSIKVDTCASCLPRR